MSPGDPSVGGEVLTEEMASSRLIGDEALGAVAPNVGKPTEGGVAHPSTRGPLAPTIRLRPRIHHQHGEPPCVGSEHLEVTFPPHLVLPECDIPRSPIGQ